MLKSHFCNYNMYIIDVRLDYVIFIFRQLSVLFLMMLSLVISPVNVYHAVRACAFFRQQTTAVFTNRYQKYRLCLFL